MYQRTNKQELQPKHFIEMESEVGFLTTVKYAVV